MEILNVYTYVDSVYPYIYIMDSGSPHLNDFIFTFEHILKMSFVLKAPSDPAKKKLCNDRIHY